MGSVNRVYAARLARMLVLGPLGESIGRVRDVVISGRDVVRDGVNLLVPDVPGELSRSIRAVLT